MSKQFKIVTKSKHFIYFVTEEDKNENWCLKIAVKERFTCKFKKAVVDEKTDFKVILKIKLAIRHQPNYMKLNVYTDSPYKIKDLKPEYKKEIKQAIIKNTITYENEKIPYYDYAIVQWEELNDKEKFYLYETPNQEQRWTNTPLDKEDTGLAMNVELVLQNMGKIENEPPYIIVQNDYEDKHNMNWVKVRLDGTVIGDAKLIFEEPELKELKTWIDINKLPILMYWTQEEIDSCTILKKIRAITTIPYPNYEPKTVEKFDVSMVWEEEYSFDEIDYDEIYNGEFFDTDIITIFSINKDMDELGISAQRFSEDFPKFLEELEQNNHAIYHNEEYSPFKWLAWIKDNKVRLMHQDYRFEEVKTEFDVLMDKDFFYETCQKMLKTMKKYAKEDLNKYKTYVLKKYGKLIAQSIPYPETEPLNIEKFNVMTEINYNDNEGFEDFYKTKDELFTSVYAYLSLNEKEEEIVFIAQDFCQNFRYFINRLKNIECAVYEENKYTETKLYGWINGEKVRLIYQDFSDDTQEIIFDISVDKNRFFETAKKLIEDVRKISETEEEKYKKSKDTNL